LNLCHQSKRRISFFQHNGFIPGDEDKLDKELAKLGERELNMKASLSGKKLERFSAFAFGSLVFKPFCGKSIDY
jgi:hypothetical protein